MNEKKILEDYFQSKGMKGRFKKQICLGDFIVFNSIIPIKQNLIMGIR